MRMWMIDPKYLCRNHLLGEHNELHKFRPSFEKKHNMNNRILSNQIEPLSMKIRHDELVVEMLRRGYNHKSTYEMPDVSYIDESLLSLKVDHRMSEVDLRERCDKCFNNL